MLPASFHCTSFNKPCFWLQIVKTLHLFILTNVYITKQTRNYRYYNINPSVKFYISDVWKRAKLLALLKLSDNDKYDLLPSEIMKCLLTKLMKLQIIVIGTSTEQLIVWELKTTELLIFKLDKLFQFFCFQSIHPYANQCLFVSPASRQHVEVKLPNLSKQFWLLNRKSNDVWSFRVLNKSLFKIQAPLLIMSNFQKWA